jgi:hypothetical protein
VTVTLSIPKPLFKYLEKRAQRQFAGVDDEVRRILVTAMHEDPVEQAAAREASKLIELQVKANTAAEKVAARQAQREAAQQERDSARRQREADHQQGQRERINKDEISETEIAEAQLLVSKFPPTGVHGKSSLKMKGVEVYNHRFKAVFMLLGVRRVLGVFDTVTEAGHACDALARKVYGKRALLNFPNHGELSARSGKLRIIRNNVETWEPAPEYTTFRLPRPIPGLPVMSFDLVPDGKGSLIEPPGLRESIERKRLEMFLAAMQEDAIAVGGDLPPPSNPHEDEEEERRLRRLAMEEPPSEEPPMACQLAVATSTDEDDDNGPH